MDEGDELTLAAPAFDHIIERPRLIAAIEEADARLVLLCAPAGYGKTTLARQWSAREKREPLWYRTTRASGDVAALAVRLDAMFAGAVGAPKNRDPNRIASIASVNPKPDPLARALVSTYKRLPKTQLVVVDEYETADTPEAEELFGALVEGLPVRWLFTSRVRPAWFEPRMTVYGQAIELAAPELTMTEEEAKAVLVLGKRGRADQAMIERAQGWPAVIGLAAMTKEKHLPADALVPRSLHDFLASELLDAAPTEVQEALLVLAAASVATLDVAQLLLGNAWKPTVEGAAKQRLILPGSQGELSVHPLLRELLIEQLHDPARRDAVISKLRPLIDNQRWDEALSAAEVIPEGRFVTAALTEALEDLLHSGRSETLRRWAAVGKTATAPAELVEYIEGELALRDAHFDKSLLLCARAAARLSGELAAKAHLCAARAAHLAEQPDKAAEHARSARELATTARTRLNALWARFTQAADAEAPDLVDAYNEFAGSTDSSYETQFRLAGGRMIISQTCGDFAAALNEGRVTSSLAGRGADPVVETAFFSVYADTLGIRAQYREALDATSSALQMAQEYGLDFVRHYVLPQKIRALIGLRRFAEADRYLKELARILKAHPDAYLSVHDANQRAGLFLSMGHPERALEAVAVEPVGCSAVGQRGERLGLRAIALAALRQHAEALDQARAAEEMSRLREVCVLTSLTKALVALANSDDARAHKAIEEGIAAGAYHQLILGLRAAPNLVDLAAQGAESRSFLTQLFLGSNDSALAQRAGLDVPRSALRTDLLSPRELEIHGLIAQGLTNREIARILFISPSTAKVHVHHVLEKLGVRTRIEAARLWEAPEDD